MKSKLVVSFVVFALMSMISVYGQEKTEKFKVYGNCGMCKTRIEKAAKSVEGVSAADWDKETKMVEVTFDESETNVHKVHMAIAEAGHATEMHKADDEAYENLPACCKYDRPEDE